MSKTKSMSSSPPSANGIKPYPTNGNNRDASLVRQSRQDEANRSISISNNIKRNAQSSANGVKSRPPHSNNSDASLRARSKLEKSNSSIGNNNDVKTWPRSKLEKSSSSVSDNPSKRNLSFPKITAIVLLIAIADVLFVWYSINASIGGEGDEPYHLGAEAGLHHLHERKRLKQLNEHMSNNPSKIQSSSIGFSHNQDRDSYEIFLETQKIDERIARILRLANVKVDDETVSKLPTWEDVVSQYGEKPIIYGLETCEAYQQSVKPADRMVGPAGIFNTGTNLLFQLMKENCDIVEARSSTTHKEPKRNGMRWQAPWGKHNPPSTHRFKNVAKMWGEGINQTAFFPVVMIKDPYGWMGSQCRHPYQSHWEHTAGNCPNLIVKSIVDRNMTEKVYVRYANGFVQYESLIDFWNKFYQEYEEQPFPHLTTRFEDLMFHAEEVTKTVCDCVGGRFLGRGRKFKYIEGSAKENGMPINKGAYGLIKALQQYGNPSNRLEGLTDRDRWYASKALDPHLMKMFGYVAPLLPT